MFDLFQYGFMLRALAAGVAVALVAGYYGVFIVQRGMSFLGSGLAHAAFGGVALGLLLQTEPLWIAIPFTVVVAVLITWLKERTNLSADTIIGVFFALTMALGIIFLSRVESFSTDAFTYLFGSILSVSTGDVWAAFALLAITAATLPAWGRWAYATVDLEAAMVDRLPVRRDNYLMSVLVAVVIVTAAKVVGIVLISAFLVIPAAAARLVSSRFSQMTLVSVVIAGACAVTGLVASYYLDLPSGATIIIINCLVFALCWIMTLIRR